VIDTRSDASGSISDNDEIAEILSALGSDCPLPAWKMFLERYSPIILQVVQLFERDEDASAGCFLSVCEELAGKNFYRLRRFELQGAASFATWLRLVVRRLCIDWHRKEFGRSRIFESVARLSELDQAVFQLRYHDGVPLTAAFPQLRSRFPHLSEQELSESLSRLNRSLTSRQLWLLSTRERKLEALDALAAAGEISLHEQIPDPSPDPESLTAGRENHLALKLALSRLDNAQRLLIRLRFEQELTLEQVARMTGLPDAQSADRRIRKILSELRRSIEKRQSASV
jgi:RNA polymerase sigma factor (sigma-70 family)